MLNVFCFSRRDTTEVFCKYLSKSSPDSPESSQAGMSIEAIIYNLFTVFCFDSIMIEVTEVSPAALSFLMVSFLLGSGKQVAASGMGESVWTW